jgi:hypothetical protein
LIKDSGFSEEANLNAIGDIGTKVNFAKDGVFANDSNFATTSTSLRGAGLPRMATLLHLCHRE